MQILSEQRYPKTPNLVVSQAAARLTISVLCTPGGMQWVRCIEIAEGRFVRRSTFSDENDPGMIFCDRFLPCLNEILGDTGKSAQISQPDYRLSLPGIVLARLRVTRKMTPDGVLCVIRFGDCIGDMSSIIIAGQNQTDTGKGQLDVLATETLEKVFLPLLDLSKQIEIGLCGADGTGGNGVLSGLDIAKKRIDEMEIYYNLLIDYVGSNGKHPRRRTVDALAALSQG